MCPALFVAGCIVGVLEKFEWIATGVLLPHKFLGSSSLIQRLENVIVPSGVDL